MKSISSNNEDKTSLKKIIINGFFFSILKDKLTKNLLAEKDIRGIKHHLSLSTLKKLKKGNKSLITINFK